MTKVKVKVCPDAGTREIVSDDDQEELNENLSLNSVVMDINEVDGEGREESRSGCVGGARQICYTKYEAECRTEQVEHRMEEDRPICKVCKKIARWKKALFALEVKGRNWSKMYALTTGQEILLVCTVVYYKVNQKSGYLKVIAVRTL